MSAKTSQESKETNIRSSFKSSYFFKIKWVYFVRKPKNLLPLVRRERDSNPRNGQAVHRISSPAQSVTLASLLVARTADKGTKENRKRFFADSRSSQYQIQQRDKSNDRTPSCARGRRLCRPQKLSQSLIL